MVSSVFYSSVTVPYLRMVSSVLELIIVCEGCRPLQMVLSAYSFHFKRMVSSVFNSSLTYLRTVSSVLELIVVCGGCRPLQMVLSAYSFHF